MNTGESAPEKKVSEKKARQAVKDYVNAQNELALITANKKREYEVVNNAYSDDEDRFTRISDKAAATVQAYAEQNRAELLPDGAKSVDFENAKIGFRASPPKLQVEGDESEVIETMLKDRNLKGFVHTKSVIDKSGIIKKADDLGEDVLKATGLKITQKETFYIKA